VRGRERGRGVWVLFGDAADWKQWQSPASLSRSSLKWRRQDDQNVHHRVVGWIVPRGLSGTGRSYTNRLAPNLRGRLLYYVVLSPIRCISSTGRFKESRRLNASSRQSGGRYTGGCFSWVFETIILRSQPREMRGRDIMESVTIWREIYRYRAPCRYIGRVAQICCWGSDKERRTTKKYSCLGLLAATCTLSSWVRVQASGAGLSAVDSQSGSSAFLARIAVSGGIQTPAHENRLFLPSRVSCGLPNEKSSKCSILARHVPWYCSYFDLAAEPQCRSSYLKRWFQHACHQENMACAAEK